MPIFKHSSRIDAPASAVFDWHKQPGAFERLLPPWEQVQIEQRTGGIREGDRVTLKSRLGPTWMRWVVEHRDYIEGEQFRDVQISGPFKRWEHTHRVIPQGDQASILEDEIVYHLPLGLLGRVLGGGMVNSKLSRMFTYRHAVTRDDVLAHLAGPAQPMRIVVTGATGLLGANLVALLTTGGHEVIALSRKPDAQTSGQAFWDTASGRVHLDTEQPIDAVVHLAGENIAGRWTAAKKDRILRSRVQGTRQIVKWMKGLAVAPRAFVCASAIGYYGDRGAQRLTEGSASGDGYLAEVCKSWEAEAMAAQCEQTRVALMRFGVVLSPRGGALAKMLTPFKMGSGGIIGNGRQTWSWVSLDDAAGAILHVLQSPNLEGPVNVVAPQTVTNHAFTKTLGAVLNRPTIAPMPAAAARLALGEMAQELLLSSQHVVPERLQSTAYRFRHSDLESALRHMLGRMRTAASENGQHGGVVPAGRLQS